MTVKSEGLHKGSTFIVELPVYSCDLFSPWENRMLCQARFGDFAASVERGPLGTTALHSLPEGESNRSTSEHHSVEITTKDSLRRGADSDSDRPTFPQRTPSAASLLRKESLKRRTEHNAGSNHQGEHCSKRKVLVVDDVASNLKMMTRLLMRGGVQECIQATNGQEAVEAYLKARDAAVALEAQTMQLQCIEEGGGDNEPPMASVAHVEPFDAILMDFEMPVMNGPTATAKLRALGCTAPIIGITGNVLPTDVQLFKEHGANAVLPKPLKIADLELVWGRNGPRAV
jgi:CheY-like chemotaxis protein